MRAPPPVKNEFPEQLTPLETIPIANGNGGLGESHRLIDEERTSPLMVKPEAAMALPGSEPFECQEAPPSSAQAFSGSKNLDDLPPSPPPLPSVSESTNVPESGYENLNPVPLPSASVLFACKMPKSVVLESEHENLCRNTHEKGPSPTADEIPSEDETVSCTAGEDIQVRSNLSDQEIVSCTAGDETPAVHSFETAPPANEITNEPTLKKSRTMREETPESGCGNLNPVPRRPRTMHKMPDQLTEVCQPDIDTDPLVSGATEAYPTGEEEMEVSQVDMNKSNEEVSDRPLREMAPPVSDRRDSETPAPPEIKTKGTPSGGHPSNFIGCLKNTIPVSVYAGGEVQFNQMGAAYSIPPTMTFPGTEHTTFKDVTDEIYKVLKLSEDLFSLNIQARYNAVSTGSFFFTLLAINDDKAWRMIFEIAISGINWRIIELYVKLVPNQTSHNGNPDPTSSYGTNSIPQWSMPMHATPSRTMSFNHLMQAYWSRPQQVATQACQNYNSNPTSSGGTSSVAQQSMPMHVNPSQSMPVQGSWSRAIPIPRNFPSKSSRTQQNTSMHAKPSQTKPKPPRSLISELIMLESECDHLNPVTQSPRTVDKMPDQLTKACQSDVGMNSLVSGTTDTGPTGDEQMEVSQIGTYKYDEVVVSDIPPTEMAPPGSDTRDSETPAPLAKRIQVTPSGSFLQERIVINVYHGGQIFTESSGVCFSSGPELTFLASKEISFDEVKRQVHVGLSLLPSKFKLRISARLNMAKHGPFFFILVLVDRDAIWKVIIQNATLLINSRFLEIAVQSTTNLDGTNCDPDPGSIPGGSNTPSIKPGCLIETDSMQELGHYNELDQGSGDDPNLYDDNDCDGSEEVHVQDVAKGQTFDSKDHLKAKILLVHIKTNIELEVESNRRNIYVVKCKDRYCTWRLIAKATGTGSWIICKNPDKHSCYGSATTLNHSQMTARGSHQNSLLDSNSRLSQGKNRNSANLSSSANHMSWFSQGHSLKRKAVGILGGKDRGKVKAGGAYKVSVAQQSMPTHVSPSQTMPHNAPVQGSFCTRPCPIPRSFPSTSSRAQQNMPMLAEPSQTKPYNPPLQGSSTRSPMVSNHQSPSRPGTSSTAQRSMPMHANPSQTMPYNYPAQGSHQNMKHSCRSINDQRAMPYKDRPSFSNARGLDDPLAVGQTFDSIDHLKVKIFEIHSKENMELEVQDDNKNIYGVKCKDRYCMWGLCAKPTGTGSWIISTNSFKHSCCGRVHVIDHNTPMTARGSLQDYLPDSYSRFSQGQGPNSANLGSFSVNQMSRFPQGHSLKGKKVGILGGKDCGKVKADGANNLNTATGTVRSTIPRLREQTES